VNLRAEKIPSTRKKVISPPPFTLTHTHTHTHTHTPQDGFTHATAEAPLLLPVANHFYTHIDTPFLCLVISPSLLPSSSIVKWEAAAPVGETKALEKEGKT
jgi:hypothetical protein